LKIKLKSRHFDTTEVKSRHFDTTEVMEAESQAVLNSLTEHDFQDAFKKMAEALGTAHSPESGAVVVSKPKVNFSPEANTSPRNYGYLFVLAVKFFYH
jgi:hypothetical protein